MAMNRDFTGRTGQQLMIEKQKRPWEADKLRIG